MKNNSVLLDRKLRRTEIVTKINRGLANLSEPLTWGSFIPKEVIEGWTGVSSKDRDYNFAILNTKEILEVLIGKQFGKRVTICQSNDGLRVLSVEEAADYAQQKFDSKQKGMEFWHLKMQACVLPYKDQMSAQKWEQFEQNQIDNVLKLFHIKEAEKEAMRRRELGMS